MIARIFFPGLVFLLVSSAVAENLPSPDLVPNGGFEEDAPLVWIPLGAFLESAPPAVTIDSRQARSGRHALRVEPGPGELAGGIIQFPGHNAGEGRRPAATGRGVHGARTHALRLDPDATGLDVEAWVRAEDQPPRLSVVWTGRKDRVPIVEICRETAESPGAGDAAGWKRLKYSSARPDGADRVQVWLETGGSRAFHIDDVTVRFQYRRHVMLLVDRLGYAPDSRAKRVVLQSTENLPHIGPVRVLNHPEGELVMELNWVAHAPLDDWHRVHWTGDFSALSEPGDYRIEVDCGGERVVSPAFEIREDLVTDHVAKLAYKFYYYQRCGMEIPGFHAACHLDDARLADGSHRESTGGWHDAGDYNKYNGLTPEALYALVWAYHRRRPLYDRWDEDANRLADIVDEALWGARFLEKLLDRESLELLSAVDSGYRYWGPPEKETDNIPSTGDERLARAGPGDLSHGVAGFALLGKALIDSGVAEHVDEGRRFVSLAERIYEKQQGGIDRLIPLYLATGKEVYRTRAHARAEVLITQARAGKLDSFREIAHFVLEFPADELCRETATIAQQRATELSRLCDDRFGVACRGIEGGRHVYCRDYGDVNQWYVGETSTRLDSAIDAMFAFHLGAAQGREIAENQVHWLLGCNPWGLSLMEGVGGAHVPIYHHRYNAIADNPRGAVPGALLNGMVRAWHHIDFPWLDVHPEPNPDYQSNEPWLLHNNRLLMLLALWE